MRLAGAVPFALLALAGCHGPADLKIDVVLEMQNGKCVVRIAREKLKKPEVAIAWTDHAVIWQVTSNSCGEKTRTKEGGKALGLRFLRRRDTKEAPPWLDRCQPLNLVPARIRTPPALRCEIPSTERVPWQDKGDIVIYEYEIDGDQVEPLDPGLGIKRNG